MSSDRRFGDALADLARRVAQLEQGAATPQLGRSSLQAGSIPVYDEAGRLRQRIGRQPDGTYAVAHVEGDPPPRPTAPRVSGRQLAVAVEWDGGFELHPRPADLARVEVHMGTDPDFTPSEATVFGALAGAGAVVIPADMTTHYVRLVAVSAAGVASDPTDAVPAQALPASEIAAGSIGAEHLAADFVLASTVTVGDPEGLRVVLDGPEGQLELYDPAGGLAGVIDGSGISFVDAAGDTVATASGSAIIARDLVASHSLTVAGQSIQDLVKAVASTSTMPRGIQAWGVVATDYTSSTEVGIAMLRFTAWSGRLYAIHASPLASGNDANSFFRLRYTTNGSAPTVSSPVWSAWDPTSEPFNSVMGWNDGVDRNVGLLWTGVPVNGVSVTFGTSSGWKGDGGFRFWVEDIGAYMDATGGAAPPPPVMEYTRTYTNSDAWSYLGDGSSWGSNKLRYHNGSCYQGSYPGDGNANQYAFFSGFGSMVDDCRNARVKKVVLTATCRHAYYNSGCDLWWGLHNLTFFPTVLSWSAGAPRKQLAHWGKGATQSLDITSWAAQPLQNGAFQGVMLGPADGNMPLAQYGYVAPSVSITVTYEK
ncbi:MAG TPA: hypothetical protein VIL00_18870 [Pseudonocardiaceae bacterium]